MLDVTITLNSTAQTYKVVKSALAALGQVPAAWRGNEEADNYPAVANLNAGWRVVTCKHSLQWVLQHRRGGTDSWRGRSFCRTREAITRCAREHAGDIADDALVILLRLPDRIGGRRP